MDDKNVSRFVKAFFSIDASVNRLGIRGHGIYIHYEYQPWSPLFKKYLSICESEDDDPLISFRSMGAGFGSEGKWDGKQINSVITALGDQNNVWVEFLRPNELSPDVSPEIRTAIAKGVTDEQRTQFIGQICKALLTHLS